MRPGLSPLFCALGAVALALALALTPAAAQAPAPQRLHIVGGLAGVNQYTRHEEPFWSSTLARVSAGSATAEIVPFDRAGIRGQDTLRLIELGVVPFGTVLVTLSAAQDPILSAPDLAGMNPDIATLRRSVAAFRPYLDKTLREQHGIELLAVYTYPAQVLFCNKAFSGLADLAKRRVRVSNAAMADLIEALGALPVNTGFAEILTNMRNGNLDCAVTGTMSGNTIGLHELTTHVHAMALGWGISIFGANAAAWAALSPELRTLLRRELAKLEQEIWAESGRETEEGIACNIGAPACSSGKKGHMTEVKATPADEQRRRELLAMVLARWVQRCGQGCAATWNQTLAPVAGVVAPLR